MRRNYFGISLMAFASLFLAASCSDDDEVSAIVDETSQPGTSTESAYIAVNICYADEGGTRATTDPDNQFVYGTEAEQNITSASFYFYNSNGDLVTTTKLFNTKNGDGTTSEDLTLSGSSNGYDEATEETIEFSGTVAVKVKDYNESNAPTQLVVILNAPDGFEPAEKLANMQTKLTGDGILNPSNVANSYKSGDLFVMAPSSFIGSSNVTNGNNAKYFATDLSKSDFVTTKELALENAKSSKAIKVYMERLAAKVKIGIDSELKTTANTYTDGINTYEYYKIGGADDHYNVWDIDETAEQGISKTETDLYAMFLGWGINGQPTYSNMFKDITESWTASTESGLGFIWDANIYYRSYWGKSYNYGKYSTYYSGTDKKYEYPAKYINEYGTIRNNASSTAEATEFLHLLYFSQNELPYLMSEAGYCPENTNTADVLNNVENYQAAATCVLIKSRLCDANGNALKLILYGGDYYTVDAYKQLVLNSTGIALFNGRDPLDANDLCISDQSSYLNGHIKVQLTEAAAAITWTNEAGTTTATAKDINDKLSAFNEESDAVAYGDLSNESSTGGDMYYSIPIEHMRGGAPTKKEIYASKTGLIKEGMFGVVRNHLYSLTINEIANPGHGVFHPDEPIIPPVEKDETYYIGVKVNVLSWHNVSQNVTL